LVVEKRHQLGIALDQTLVQHLFADERRRRLGVLDWLLLVVLVVVVLVVVDRRRRFGARRIGRCCIIIIGFVFLNLHIIIDFRSVLQKMIITPVTFFTM
jgi:hypothetical protein